MTRYFVNVMDGREHTLPELAKLTGIKYITLYVAAVDGRLDARQSGSIWLSSQAAIAHAIKAGKIRGNRRERDG